MEEMISVFRANELSVATRIRVIIQLGRALNRQYAMNWTEGIVYELVLALDPGYPLTTDAQYVDLLC